MEGRNLPMTALAAMLFITTAAPAQSFHSHGYFVPSDLGKEHPPEVKEPSWRTNNFVVTASSKKVARKVGRAAERYRKELALLWLGEEAATWDEPCEVRVNVTDHGRYDSTSTGFLDGKLVEYGVELKGSLDEILEALPLQVTHTLLADRLGRPLPRWAEVGTGELAETRAVRERGHRWVSDNIGKKRFMALNQLLLLPLNDYPKDPQAFFAEGLSLTEFLVQIGGRAKYLAFVAQGERDGWDKAAEAQYDYATVEELERAWLTHVQEGAESEGCDRQTPRSTGNGLLFQLGRRRVDQLVKNIPLPRQVAGLTDGVLDLLQRQIMDGPRLGDDVLLDHQAAHVVGAEE